ncbi:MAG: hypothetical protein K8W52_40040 [Deltaproteobacteria bacterium]|nr:hypothetical protein [Deltaproteobacteria bacterium]
MAMMWTRTGLMRLPAPLVVGVIAVVIAPLVGFVADHPASGYAFPVLGIRWALELPAELLMVIGLMVWRARARPDARASVTIAAIAVMLAALLQPIAWGLAVFDGAHDGIAAAIACCAHGAWTVTWLALAATGVAAARSPRTIAALAVSALACAATWLVGDLAVLLAAPALLIALDRAGETVVDPPAFGERVAMRTGVARLGAWLLALAVAATVSAVLAMVAGADTSNGWSPLGGPVVVAVAVAAVASVIAAMASRATFPGAPRFRLASAALVLGGWPVLVTFGLAPALTPPYLTVPLVARGALGVALVGGLALVMSAARGLAVADDRAEHARRGRLLVTLIAAMAIAGVALSLGPVREASLGAGAVLAAVALFAAAAIVAIAIACRRAGGRIPLPRPPRDPR